MCAARRLFSHPKRLPGPVYNDGAKGLKRFEGFKLKAVRYVEAVMTRYGISPWIDRFPKSRTPSYPRHRGLMDVDVAIVGGGLTGCATAYAFAAAGVKVALLEQNRIGHGSSGFASGWIADEPAVSFLRLERALGRRSAREVWQAWHRAALDFAALLRRLDVKCHLEPCSTLTVTITPEQTTPLARERRARREAGLEAPFITARGVSGEVAISSSGAVRASGSATIDPYRACLGLAAAAAARGARLFERSPVRSIKFGRKAVDIQAMHGTIRAGRVIVATGVPTTLFSSLARHFWFKTAYFALSQPIPLRIRRQLGQRAAVVRDSTVPPHLIRWVGDEQLLVSGADLQSPPPRRRERIVVQRTGQLMYELSTLYPEVSGVLPEYGWDAAYGRTFDGLPYIGPHRNFPRHLFAFGDATCNVTAAYLASRILLRRHLDESDPADEVFAFTRHGR